ncbi:MAG: DUF393 domain-containing protein [Actinobacteria bacterium]|jgi:predicted DCC family thiol-disulfide oxidoreductase YuxK|nr:DUF393 domain-containing protein [Actinomycetota bacterium]
MADIANTKPDVRGGTLVFDGDCGFCSWSAGKVAGWSSGRVSTLTSRGNDLAALQLSLEQCDAAVQYVDLVGTYSGGAAVARALKQCRQPLKATGYLLANPLLSPVTERLYAVVAANRHRLPGSTASCDPSARSG